MTGSKGFSLVETIALVAILAIIVSVSLLFVSGRAVDQQKLDLTRALVNKLETACENYRKDTGRYPPAQPYSGSQNLHHYLGRTYLTFETSELEGEPKDVAPDPPRYIVDHFGGLVQYLNPGVRNRDGVDIWSMGPDGTTDVNEESGNDVGNWQEVGNE